MEQAPNRQQARIQPEHFRADILLFAGISDNIWIARQGCKAPEHVMRLEQSSMGSAMFAGKACATPFTRHFSRPPG